MSSIYRVGEQDEVVQHVGDLTKATPVYFDTKARDESQGSKSGYMS